MMSNYQPPDYANHPFNLKLRQFLDESPPINSISITEFDEIQVNPMPQKSFLQDESENIIRSYLSPQKLRDLTLEDDLSKIRFLEMKVDSSENSLNNFGRHLPNLSQLKLSNSLIPALRDLGSSLNNLKILWMARCGLQDLDGLSSMYNLNELYLAYNDIQDMTPINMLSSLKVLDLEGNNIEDIGQIENLSLCSQLRNLTLEGNPLCSSPQPDKLAEAYDYRLVVRSVLPNLLYLDEELLESRTNKSKQNTFAEDWELIQELINDKTLLPCDEEESLQTSHHSVDESPNSCSKHSSPASGYRPGSALKRQTTPKRPMTGWQNLGTTRQLTTPSGIPLRGRPATSCCHGLSSPSNSSEGTVNEDALDDFSSSLTLGFVVNGNISRALRNRNSATQKQTIIDQMKHVPEHTYDIEKEDDPTLKSLFKELRDWKDNYALKQKKIDESKAPQVLRLDEAQDNADSDQSENDQIYKSPYNKFMKETSKKEVTSTPHHAKSSYNLLSDEETLPISDSGIQMFNPVQVSHHHKSVDRPVTGPAAGARSKFKLQDGVNKEQSHKQIDRDHPIIRHEVQSPEQRAMVIPRAGTSRAALNISLKASPSTGAIIKVNRNQTAAANNELINDSLNDSLNSSAKMRRGLRNAELLPSKFSSNKVT